MFGMRMPPKTVDAMPAGLFVFLGRLMSRLRWLWEEVNHPGWHTIRGRKHSIVFSIDALAFSPDGTRLVFSELRRNRQHS